MITAVDTNILLDVVIPGAPHGDESEGALGAALSAGALVVSEPVYAEMAAHFPDRAQLDVLLEDVGIRIQGSSAEALHRAGRAWQDYLRRRPASVVCPACGHAQDVRCERCSATIRSRQHVVADFVIGAHALVHADRLLTRDRGFYATYFPDLALG